ncbi:MAG: ferric reductase-like transmembrane domain-containing protein, partial [Acetobacteraceae bacterium]
IWRGPSLLLSVWSVNLMAVLLLAAVRSRWIEPLFGGLDGAIRLHRTLGPMAVLVMVTHTLLYVPMALERGESVGDLLIPFWSANARNSLSLIFVGLLIGTALAYTRRLRYERWLSLHSLFGLLFIATSIHAVTHGVTIAAFEPLRFWMWLLILIGSMCWLYRVVLYRWVHPRYPYKVRSVQVVGKDTVEFYLRPQQERLLYAPGTFVFINRPGPAGRHWELHPFSISSSPTERDLRLSARMVGDFTNSLANLRPGESIEVIGPFGGFTPHRHARFRRLVCIGSGIGITPFLSMIRFEASNDDFRRIWLWYVARGIEDAPYDEELRKGVETADSWVDYELWLTSERGRLTASHVFEALEDFDDFAVMLCGSPQFIRGMSKQFLDQGLPPDRLFAEDLFFH